MIECKNYGHDVANPELDQLSGRLTLNRGKFGMLLCRDVENYERLIQRCRDFWKDKGEVIIPILDADLVKILRAKAGAPDGRPEEELLAEKIRSVMLA